MISFWGSTPNQAAWARSSHASSGHGTCHGIHNVAWKECLRQKLVLTANCNSQKEVFTLSSPRCCSGPPPLKFSCLQEVVLQLGELICMNGFETDADQFAERLTITSPRPEIGLVSPFEFDLSYVSPAAEATGYLNPHSIAFCKGWTRSHCCVLVMHLAYEHEKFFQARRDVLSIMVQIIYLVKIWFPQYGIGFFFVEPMKGSTRTELENCIFYSRYADAGLSARSCQVPCPFG